jgi:ubiquinol-cytochrome c reductase cytochrome b subunit
MVFAASFIVLGWLGMQPATPFYGELAFRLTELYFGFFVVLFAYSRRRSAGEMHLYTLLSLGFVVAIDLARFWALGFDKVHEFQWILMILPLAFAFLYMQLPIHTKLNEPLPVPERVTP